MQTELAVEAMRLGVVLVPLAAYLFFLGVINSGRRPILVTGIRDGLALGMGICGLVLTGPVELILRAFPGHSYGYLRWVVLISALSALVLAWLPRAQRRLVIYNLDPARFGQLWPQLVRQLDAQPVLMDSQVWLPRLGLGIQVERFPLLRNTTLVAQGRQASFETWQHVRQLLARELEKVEVDPGNFGRVMIVSGSLLLLAVPSWFLLSDPQGMAQALWQLLRTGFH